MKISAISSDRIYKINRILDSLFRSPDESGKNQSPAAKNLLYFLPRTRTFPAADFVALVSSRLRFKATARHAGNQGDKTNPENPVNPVNPVGRKLKLDLCIFSLFER